MNKVESPRKTHPNLYKSVTALGLVCVSLGLNFIFLKPAFDPLDIPKEVFGVIFLALGLTQLFFLNFYRARLLRMVMAVGVAILIFYTLLLVVQFFQKSQTSLQLPITCFGIALWELYSLLEPFINPATSKENDDVVVG